MSKAMTYGDTTKMVIAIATAMLLVVGLVYFLGVRNTFAVAPSDYGLHEGDTVSAAGSDDPDVYIINDWGYKRLFLNPAIFGFYGHLGGFAKVKSISPATRDAFGTSGLFRNCETNDEKVYGVETTGEDTGMLHWVNTTGSQAVADDANFFKKVFCINSNEFNWYSKGSNYTSVSQVPSYSRTPGATPAPTGPLSVSLASGNPAAATITRNAAGQEYLRVHFTGSGTINTVTLKRGGAGKTADFTNVYVYDGAKRLTSGKSFSSSSGEVTFINLNVAVNGSKELSVVGDMAGSSATVGDVNSVSLTAVGATGTVSNLPLNGNLFVISGASSGTIDTAVVGNLTDPNVGQQNALLVQFKLTANTEGASVKRLTLLQGGSVKPSDISGLQLKSGSNTWSGSMTSDGYMVFDLGSGLVFAKGGNATFQVYGNLGGKRTETIILYFENDSDILAIGDQYGNGMAEGTNSLDTSTEATTLTLQGGVLTLAFNGPGASNIGTTTQDTDFLEYSMTGATNIEVRKTRLVICKDTAGNGTYNDANNTSGFSGLEDVKVTDMDSGAIVLGPQDGTAFTTSDTNTCPDSATGASYQFTDTFDLAAGVTRRLKVTADVKQANTTGTTVTSGDIVKIALNNYTTDTPDVAVMRYSGTTTAVQDADIAPAADIMGPALTLNSASLTLGLAGTPGSQTFIKGTKNVDMVGITFAAGQSSALKVTDITLTGYVDEGTGGAVDATAFNEGVDTTNSGVSIANAVTNVRLIEGESGATIASWNNVAGGGNQLATTNTGTLKFSGFTWNIAAGATKTALVRVDLTNNTASGTEGDFYAFDINTTSEVSALDDSNNSVNPTAASVDPNGATTPTKYLTVKNNGSVTIAQSPSSPAKSAIYWGQTNVPVSMFRIQTTNEAQYVEKFTVIASAANEAVDSKANVKKVRLSYKNKAGSTLTSEQSFTSGASANFGWSCDSTCTAGGASDLRPYVPKDSSADITVSADLRTSSEGATQDLAVAGASPYGAGSYSNVNTNNSGASFSLDFSDTYSGSTANGFKLVGDGSGAVIDGSTSGIADVLGKNNMIVYRVFPKIDNIPISAPYDLIGTPDVLKFSITAMGLSDSKLFFDNQDTVTGASGAIKFEVVASGDAYGNSNASSSFTVYDEAGVTVDVMRGNHDPRPSPHASMTMDFGANLDGAGTTGQDVEITGGQTKTFRVQFTNPSNYYALTSNTTGRGKDYFSLTIQDDENGLIRWVGNSTSSTADHNSESYTGSLKNVPIYGPTFQR